MYKKFDSMVFLCSFVGNLKLITMKFTALKGKFRIKFSRTPQDPEKCVLPTVLYINTNHSAFEDVKRKGFMIVIGWWDISLKIGLIF